MKISMKVVRAINMMAISFLRFIISSCGNLDGSLARIELQAADKGELL